MTSNEIFWLLYVLPGLIILASLLLYYRAIGDPINKWNSDDKGLLLLIIAWPAGLILGIASGIVSILFYLLELTTKEITFKKHKKQ